MEAGRKKEGNEAGEEMIDECNDNRK